MSRVCWCATVENYFQPLGTSAISEEGSPNNVMFHIHYFFHRTRANDLHIQQCYQVTQFLMGYFVNMKISTKIV